MTLKLYDELLSVVLVEKDYHDPLLPSDEVIRECTTQLNHPYGRGYYKEIYFEGVHIGFGNAFLSEKVLLQFESDYETVEMHFALRGRNTATAAGFPQPVSFDAFQHNILYANSLQGKMEWESDELSFLEINFHPSFFSRFLPDDLSQFASFRNDMEKGLSRILNPRHSTIGYRMYEIIQEIIRCERKGLFKRMFLEAKVIELLLLQLEQMVDSDYFETSLRRQDIEKLYAVREFLIKNIHHSCTLIDLAHRFGLNEFTLKKGFKELFNTTVFGFWQGCKMQQAKILITEKDMNISEVAYQIGYKHPRHFSEAFKRHFGFVPSRLKK